VFGHLTSEHLAAIYHGNRLRRAFRRVEALRAEHQKYWKFWLGNSSVRKLSGRGNMSGKSFQKPEG
jgi:hypothetical protein